MGVRMCGIACVTKQLSGISASLQTELTEDMIERVKLNVNRDSPEDKLRDFMEWMKALKEETDYQVCVGLVQGDAVMM